MEDKEPCMNLNVYGERVEARRDNTTLYTFLGHLACYNHVFVVTDSEEPSGFYIFGDQPVFKEMAEYMFETDYPMHLNMPEVAECDVDAWNRHVHDMCGDIEDTIPEDWDGTDTV